MMPHDLGLRQPLLEGEEYLAVVDEFMEAVHARCPKAVVQVIVQNCPAWIFQCLLTSVSDATCFAFPLYLTRLLASMDPTYMKLGQFIASAPIFFSCGVCSGIP